jgi:HlyD family secretion protein
VKSNVEGEIEALYVSEGDYVEKGQILLKIDDKQIREERNQADANLKAAEAQLEQAQRNILLTATLKEGGLKQAQTAVDVAQASMKATKNTTIQMIIEASMEIAKTRNALEQDKISIRQAEIAERQAQLAMKQAQARLQSAEVAQKNADAELQRIQKLYDKQFVSKGTLEDTQAKQAADSAQYEQAQQDLESHRETIKLQQENLLALKKVLDERQMTLAFQEQNLELLREEHAAIEAQVEAELQNAKTHYEQLLASIDAEKEISVYSEASAQANSMRAQSNLKNAEERLAWTTIKSPIYGTITQLSVKIGEIITSGRSAFSQSPVLMVISDLSRIVVRVNVNEVDIGKIKVGQRAEIRASAYPDRSFAGEVTKIAKSGQKNRDLISFEVLVMVIDPPKELLPGMSADVDIIYTSQDTSRQ